MIIEYDFAKDLLEKIERELYEYDENHGINVHETLPIGINADFKSLWETQNYSLPIFSSGATEIIQITNRYYEILVSEWKENHPKLMKGGIRETAKSEMQGDFVDETIHSAIYSKINALIYEYDLVLKATKKSNHLFGIEDEEKILLIHLNKYNELINSDTKQIEYLTGIKLNKKISDLVLEIYIRFIKKRLALLNPEPIEIEVSKGKVTKILWKGSQKDLCELFVELQEKNWIDKFRFGERNKIAASICNLFDLTLTKRDENSNPENSFYQILKGVYNKENMKREYDEVLGKKKDRKFNKIKEK